MSFIIKEYSNSEKKQLSEIFYQILRDEFNWVNKQSISLDSFEKSTDGEAIYVALVDNEIAGFISVWEQDNFIHNLFVSKKYRKIGVGKKLLEKTTAIYDKPLTLKCVKENHSAVRFYLDNGWKIEKEEKVLEGPSYLISFGS